MGTRILFGGFLALMTLAAADSAFSQTKTYSHSLNWEWDDDDFHADTLELHDRREDINNKKGVLVIKGYSNSWVTGSDSNKGWKLSWHWKIMRTITRSGITTVRTLTLSDDSYISTINDHTIVVKHADWPGQHTIDRVRGETQTITPQYLEGANPTRQDKTYNDTLIETEDNIKAKEYQLYDDFRFRKENGRWFKVRPYFGYSYGIYRAYRFLSVSALQLQDNNGLTHRQNTELSTVGRSQTYTVGLRLSASHALTLEGTALQQGFRGDSLDWNTGYPANPATAKRDQMQVYGGFGIGYCYAPDKHAVSVTDEIGFYALWLQNREEGQRAFTWGFKLGCGITYRPAYWLELRLVPTAYINMRSLNGGELKTNPYSLGFSVGAGWRVK